MSRREQILETAAELFARRGFHGVSVAEIGAACGISGPALYKHFAGKDEVLAAMLVSISERLLAEGSSRVAADPDAAVLVLTMFDDDDSVFAAMRAGARGYLVKGADSPDVQRAISAVAGGEAIFGPGVAERVLGYLTRPLSVRDETMFPELTQREREVLALLAAGRGNNAIAGELSLSSKTIRNLVSSIFAKLQVADRAEAIVRARRAGLGVEDRERR